MLVLSVELRKADKLLLELLDGNLLVIMDGLVIGLLYFINMVTN